MIDLTSEDHEALQRLVRAGAAGRELGDGITASHAIRFGLQKLATITDTHPQVVQATAMGAAFLRRSAA